MKEISITEFLGRSHPLVQMPPLWGVIYYEGIHGNHILFAPQEVKDFEDHSLVSETLEEACLEDVGFTLSSRHSYRDMVDYISSLTHNQRRRVYHLYKSWLQNMSDYLKDHAH